MAARLGRCWYCGEARLADDDPPEHVVPAVLGGELKTDHVCHECNTAAGQHIDKPLLKDWLVGWERVLWDIRDNRRPQDRPPPIPKEELMLPSGARARLRQDGTIEVIPDVCRDGGNVSIVAGSDGEAEEIIEKITERAKRDGETLTLEDTRREFSNEVAGRVQLSGLVWLRATTKMAVAAASLVLDESWLDTAQAAKYREFLWKDNPTTYDGKHPATAFPQEQHPLMADLLSPPDHLVLMVPARERVLVRTTLFGNLSAGTVEFDVAGIPPQNAWVLDPRSRRVEETTMQELLARAVARRTQTQAPAGESDSDS